MRMFALMLAALLSVSACALGSDPVGDSPYADVDADKMGGEGSDAAGGEGGDAGR